MTAGYAEVDLVQARSHGRELASSGKLQQARQVLLAGLAQTYALEEDYAPALDLLAQVLWQEGDARGALTCAWYLGDDELADQAGERAVAEDRARTFVGLALRRGRGGANVSTYYDQAARQFEDAGRIAQAAVCRERAEQHAVARPLWSRLCHAIGQSTDGDLYAAALARFNLARTSRRVGDMRTAREATVASVHLLEQAADRYESVGQRERAFDCYQVLAAIGRDSGTVEHALEGFINLTRILREDQLRSYALREYGNAIRFLRERGEVAAAATLASEMAQYARREGLVAVANNAVLEQAGMWRELAQGILQRNGPVEIAENALLAAVLSYAELGQFSRAGAAYLELAHLPLEQARRTQYARASARYHGARDEALDAVRSPDVGRRDDALHDVWHVDLIEWEHSGSAAEVCADVIVDVETWSDVIRRRALLARLVALPLEGSSVPVAAQDWQRLVDALAPTELYVTLSPLEHLYDHPDPAVRCAVVHALGRFLYKRSFMTLRRALSDPAPTVRARAADSVEQLHFPHAFDPLARIYRESVDLAPRLSALRALAKVDTEEATEMVMGVLRHAGPSEREQVVRALSKSCGPRLLRAATDAMPSACPDFAKSLRDVLGAQGLRSR